ncbi:caspase family protein [Frigidibacter sp. MR17.14]|uniref:caspase family protein n=1 Tax=Frigidibacter sp. MR17.14 TaxID=3126509 RepID=UPI003012ADD0
MAKKSLKILGLHGLGGQSLTGYAAEWEAVIRAQLPDSVAPSFVFPTYDPLFKEVRISPAETLAALWKLAASGLGATPGARAFGLPQLSEAARWSAGYVVAWAADEAFKARTRAFILEQLVEHAPDVVLAHSLGSLLSYDAFAHRDAAKSKAAKLLEDVHYVTFGSQLGNRFVRGNLTNGRTRALAVRRWTHLYNIHDDVFTAPLTISGAKTFHQVLTPFNEPGVGDHSAVRYLSEPSTRAAVWEIEAAPRAAMVARAFLAPPPGRRKRRRALLVGINDYPVEAQRLQGCVNDCYTMSAVLQDCGFDPDDIRLCLDDRATAAAILERLHWLLDGAEDGDELVFYYSGHGTRVASYGADGRPDHLNEVLVPWDFDWTPDRAISDAQLCDLYGQLPYDCHFMMMLDCCHAGGMHRQTGARPRGIDPPDDIRHRELKWDRATQMWVDRSFARVSPAFTEDKALAAAYLGRDADTLRLGRAAALRTQTDADYDADARRAERIGPYQPIVIEACGEAESSFEYRHGATSHGAFTFVMASLLRTEKDVTFRALVDRAAARLAELGYRQTPQLLAPAAILAGRVPFDTGNAPPPGPAPDVPGGATPRTSG